MVVENADVRAKREHTRQLFTGGVQSAFDAGEIAGADANANNLEPWAFAILSRLTARQRGYLLGVLIAEDERAGDDHN